MEETKIGFWSFLYIYGKYIAGIALFIVMWRGCSNANDTRAIIESGKTEERKISQPSLTPETNYFELGTQALANLEYQKGIDYLSKVPVYDQQYPDAQDLIKAAKIAIERDAQSKTQN